MRRYYLIPSLFGLLLVFLNCNLSGDGGLVDRYVLAMQGRLFRCSSPLFERDWCAVHCFLGPVDRWVESFQPGHSQDNSVASQVGDVEGLKFRLIPNCDM